MLGSHVWPVLRYFPPPLWACTVVAAPLPCALFANRVLLSISDINVPRQGSPPAVLSDMSHLHFSVGDPDVDSRESL